VVARTDVVHKHREEPAQKLRPNPEKTDGTKIHDSGPGFSDSTIHSLRIN
jgi:hypothetical protein